MIAAIPITVSARSMVDLARTAGVMVTSRALRPRIGTPSESDVSLSSCKTEPNLLGIASVNSSDATPTANPVAG